MKNMVMNVNMEQMEIINPQLAESMKAFEENPQSFKEKVKLKMIDDTFEHVDDRYDNLPKMNVGAGFVCVCTIDVLGNSGGSYTALVNDTLMNMMFDDKDEMFEMAIENSEPVILSDLFSYMLGGGSGLSANVLDDETFVAHFGDLFFLTCGLVNGASAIALPGIKEKIAKCMGGSYWVIPCSVHELIIVPDNEHVHTAEEMNNVIGLVNGDEECFDDPKSILSDKARFYEAETGRLYVGM